MTKDLGSAVMKKGAAELVARANAIARVNEAVYECNRLRETNTDLLEALRFMYGRFGVIADPACTQALVAITKANGRPL